MRNRLTAVLAATCIACAAANAADNIKVAFIDPLSGPFANLGEAEARHFQLVMEGINARGGVLGGRNFELVTFDSKASPQEAVLALKQVIDQGIRYILQGNSSSVAHALVDTLDKHNKRNPDQAVMFLNYAAVDPALTNDKCTFFHFRFDADADMKTSAITDALAQDKNVSKVYLLNQDYAFGQAVSRTAKVMIAKKRPDIQIVGDDLHPLGKVKDFAPYVAKIKASGANAVLTGNWGNDLALLIKASKDAGLKVEYYTFYAFATGTPSAIGESGAGHLKLASQWHSNVGTPGADKWVTSYRERYKSLKDDFIFTTPVAAIEMLTKAMTQANSAEPLAVGKALEGMKWQSDTGEVIMRADNHQLLQPMFISTFVKADGRNPKFDVERTGFGFRTDRRIEAKDTMMSTTCKMERP
ncbi:MAG: branched-chain amino acid ABC transporter substrate-binding protein [Betaproteobacteria bacterium]|nr:branched-chain amino acid ABC transporter substrate-binding protein [Betaproteobacteria bacterium]